VKVADCRPLITGAGRGLGRAFVEEFLDAGVPVIYAGCRSQAHRAELAALDTRVHPVLLDTTVAERVQAAVAEAADMTVLVNNAGVERNIGLLEAATLDDARAEMEANYFGPLAMVRAFAPRLAAVRGAIVNVLSVASLTNVPDLGSYSASKAAAHSMTQGIRANLGPLGVRIIAVYPGVYDTDMAWHVSDPSHLNPPRLLTGTVRAALFEGGPDDLFPDALSQTVGRMSRQDPDGLVAMFARMARPLKLGN
jgi:NAD(P)-dependent dehydrogenase (short-subunit alcohol dehydrogenase family)